MEVLLPLRPRYCSSIERASLSAALSRRRVGSVGSVPRKVVAKAAGSVDTPSKINPAAGPEKLLENWLKENGCKCDPLTLRRVQGEGRGLVVATPKVNKGQTIVAVPSNLVITRDLVLRTSRHRSIIESKSIPEWPALAIWLLEQREGADDGDGSFSWGTYMASLPQETGSIVEWSESQVESCLQGSWLLPVAKQQRADFMELVRDLQAIFDEDRARFPPQHYNDRQLIWAFSILLSRLIRLQSQGGALALVPWADMMNHAVDSTAFFDFDGKAGSGSLVLRADRNYKEGEQACASYGQLSSGRLLLSYGFVPKPGTCPYDEAGVTLRIPEEFPFRDAKIATLERVTGLKGGEEVLPLRMKGVPSRLVSFARFACIDVPPEQLEKECREIVQQDRATAAVTADVELEARLMISDALSNAIDGYKTTVEGDQQEAALVAKAAVNPSTEFPPTTPSALQRAAAAVRVGERRILYRAQSVVQAEIAELRRGISIDPSGKVAPAGRASASDLFSNFLKRITKQ